MENINIMGQRLIISEEEKRNIQGMYGLINEESSIETIDLNKDDEISVEEKIADRLLPSIENLTPEQINQLKSELEHLGVTPDSSVKDVTNNIKDITNNIESSLNEDEEEEGSTVKEKVADVLSDVGSALMKSLLVPIIPVVVGSTTGIGFAGGFAVTTLTAGALIGLAKALGKKEDSTEFGNY